jgi:hypothetical protein
MRALLRRLKRHTTKARVFVAVSVLLGAWAGYVGGIGPAVIVGVWFGKLAADTIPMLRAIHRELLPKESDRG